MVEQFETRKRVAARQKPLPAWSTIVLKLHAGCEGTRGYFTS